jgi:hypothetical protein
VSLEGCPGGIPLRGPLELSLYWSPGSVPRRGPSGPHGLVPWGGPLGVSPACPTLRIPWRIALMFSHDWLPWEIHWINPLERYLGWVHWIGPLSGSSEGVPVVSRGMTPGGPWRCFLEGSSRLVAWSRPLAKSPRISYGIVPGGAHCSSLLEESSSYVRLKGYPAEVCWIGFVVTALGSKAWRVPLDGCLEGSPGVVPRKWAPLEESLTGSFPCSGSQIRREPCNWISPAYTPWNR